MWVWVVSVSRLNDIIILFIIWFYHHHMWHNVVVCGVFDISLKNAKFICEK